MLSVVVRRLCGHRPDGRGTVRRGGGGGGGGGLINQIPTEWAGKKGEREDA